MGRPYTEPEIKLVPQHVSTYYLSRTRDPDDEFACEQAMTTFGTWRDVGPEGISLLDHYIFDSRYAASSFLGGYRIGREESTRITAAPGTRISGRVGNVADERMFQLGATVTERDPSRCRCVQQYPGHPCGYCHGQAGDVPFEGLTEASRMLTQIGTTPDGGIVVGPQGWAKLQEALKRADA